MTQPLQHQHKCFTCSFFSTEPGPKWCLRWWKKTEDTASCAEHTVHKMKGIFTTIKTKEAA